MNFKRALIGSVMGAATVASPAALAGATGNVGAFSEYLFRGIETSGGAAVQGGLDYAHDSGLYVGTWASNTGGPAAAGGTELDLYGGFAFKAGPVGFDLGAIYYLYPEDEEDLDPAAFGGETDFDYWEVYAKMSVSYFAVQVYYADEYLGDANKEFAESIGNDTEGLYVNVLANLPLSETLTLGLQAGFTSGDGAEAAWSADGEDGYEDYSISLTKALDQGFSMGFGVYATSFEQGDGLGTVAFDDDGPKVVVSLKKVFEL